MRIFLQKLVCWYRIQFLFRSSSAYRSLALIWSEIHNTKFRNSKTQKSIYAAMCEQNYKTCGLWKKLPPNKLIKPIEYFFFLITCHIFIFSSEFLKIYFTFQPNNWTIVLIVIWESKPYIRCNIILSTCFNKCISLFFTLENIWWI